MATFTILLPLVLEMYRVPSRATTPERAALTLVELSACEMAPVVPARPPDVACRPRRWDAEPALLGLAHCTTVLCVCAAVLPGAPHLTQAETLAPPAPPGAGSAAPVTVRDAGAPRMVAALALPSASPVKAVPPETASAPRPSLWRRLKANVTSTGPLTAAASGAQPGAPDGLACSSRAGAQHEVEPPPSDEYEGAAPQVCAAAERAAAASSARRSRAGGGERRILK